MATKAAAKKATVWSEAEESKIRTATQIFMFVMLLGVVELKLLPALLAGLLVYQLVHHITPLLSKLGFMPKTGKAVALLLIVSITIAAVTFGIMGFISLVHDDKGGLTSLFVKMADIVDSAADHLPDWVTQYMPQDNESWQTATSEWLRHNASTFSKLGQGLGVSLIYIIIGMIVGGMIAYGHEQHKPNKHAPLASILVERVVLLSKAFRRIVFSQVRISAVNTTLTGIFIVAILPMFDVDLPLKQIIILVTFVAGLLPVVGNLISNTVIVLISLGISPEAAFGSLTFLVVIHKLEYFLNAHIIGTNIQARAWELLLAMLLMEAAFGVPGLVAAPVYYAYFKDELVSRKLL